jgi:hypothetical protein
MNGKRIMNQRLVFGAAVAQRLTKVGVRVRLRDACTDVESVTTSMPWQLGHGEWVVSVEGKSGGWSCANIIILESEVAA